jgi:hypothetical protein
MNALDHMSETAKHWIDVFSVGALVATFFEWVPEATAVLVLIWTGLRIYESILVIREKRRALK